MLGRVDLSKDLIIRWDNPEPAHVDLLKKARVAAVLCSAGNRAFSDACSSAGIQTIQASELRFVSLDKLGSTESDTGVVLTTGLWPGIRRPPTVKGRGDETASASREPWVDSNGYLAGYLRALYPKRAPVLGYLPEGLDGRVVPFDSLELALVESWTAGGNYLLAVEPNYRQALLSGDPKAISAWESLGRTAHWLREHIAIFRQPAIPIVTALVEPGAATAEIANLLYRRNVSPFLAPAWDPPAADARATLAVVAANLSPPSPAIAGRILAHAEAGSTVVTAGLPSRAWWQRPELKPVRSEPDRDFYDFGKGQVVAYKRPIVDPSEFALDVIDIITHKQRAVRLWNAPSVIALATASPRKGERLLPLINYGAPIDTELQARVQGHFSKAQLLRPDAPPLTLPVAKRGSTTEVFVPELKRAGVVVFGGG